MKEAGVQVKTSGGNAENLNNIAPGTKSDVRSFAPENIMRAGLLPSSIYVIYA